MLVKEYKAFHPCEVLAVFLACDNDGLSQLAQIRTSVKLFDRIPLDNSTVGNVAPPIRRLASVCGSR